MLVFLDTEFTDFARPELISLALVSGDGRDFYVERTDYRQNECSAFVQETVLPLLGRVPGAACDSAELVQRLQSWFGALPEQATIVFDYATDWHLLAQAMFGRPKKTRRKISARRSIWTATPSRIHFSRKRKTSFTQRPGPRIMRWRSWQDTAPARVHGKNLENPVNPSQDLGAALLMARVVLKELIVTAILLSGMRHLLINSHNEKGNTE